MIQRRMSRLACVTSKIVRAMVRISRCFPCTLREIPLVLSFLSPLRSNRAFVPPWCIRVSDGFRRVPSVVLFACLRSLVLATPISMPSHVVPLSCQLVQ